MKTKLWLLALCLALCALLLVACGHREGAGKETPAPQSSVRVLPLAATAQKTTGFSVSKAFSSDMVIQRDEPIRVWGWADESRNGETVTAAFAGKSAEGKIENGAWLVTFDGGFAASAAPGNDMTVTCGADRVVFEDVLVGDVYMVIGQSNVAYQVEVHCASQGLSLQALVDERAPIRLKYNTLNDTAGYPARGTETVCPDVVNGRSWTPATVQNARSFSAIGYLFACELVERTGGEIPIGLIEIDGNGQPIGAFMPNEAAGETDSDTYRSGIFVPPGVNGTHARYMYNHYMYPYERYAMAGVVWYQGESDFEAKNTETYVNKFVALMEHMRSTHNLKNRDFPVYIVELPTIYNRPADFQGDFHTMDLGYIRAEMGSIPAKLPNSYLAVSSDAFANERYYNSLHPDIKGPQAERLADIAGSVWYGLTPLDEATGPILRTYAVSEDRKTVTLTFDNVGEGLTTSDGGREVKGFVALNRLGAPVPSQKVTATITAEDQITVTAERSMYGIAYNCVMDNFFGRQINLCNSHGRIAAAFTYSELRMYQTRRTVIGDGAEDAVPAAGDTWAVHFRTGAPTVAIGTRLVNLEGRTGSITLKLYAFDTDYATSVASKPLETVTFSDFDDCSFAELTRTRNSTWPAGEYLLVLSEASGVVLRTGGGHEGQVCYRDGEYDEGMSLLLSLTYESAVASTCEIPVDPNTAPPETLPPETAPAPESATASETEPATAPTDPATSETAAPDESGCASTFGGMLALYLLFILPAVLRPRKSSSDE